MKNIIGQIRPGSIVLLLGLLLSFLPTAEGQFSTTIGFPHPAGEKAVSGLIAPTGGYVILGDNFNHPNGLFNPNGDLELVWLDNLGNLGQPSKMLGLPTTESAGWIEKDVICSSTNHYVIAGSDQDDILVTMTDLAGDPLWVRRAGSPNDIESSVWVEMDANGLINLVGNKYDVISGVSSVVALQVDCGGTNNWRMTYSLNGYSLTATSATTFATFPGGFGIAYITGRATPLAGGDEQLFVLRINTTSGSPAFIFTYDIAPGAHDIGTCIQGRISPVTPGEIWVSGFSEDANGVKNVLMMKTDLNGSPIWANNYDVAGGDEFATHFEFAANNKLILTGRAEEATAFQATKRGDCLLLRMNDAGNAIDWTRVFTNDDFSSRGNRVEVTANDEYFITGQSLELLSPSQSANNILAIRTDPQGRINTSDCFHDTMTQIIPRTPIATGFSVAAFTLGQIPDFLITALDTLSYSDQQVACSSTPSSCTCDFTWTTGNCFQVQFTANCMNPLPPPSIYTYQWDINCDGVDATTTTPNYAHTFPCGGGTYTVCLNVLLNGVVCSSITHTVTVPSTCCGSVSGSLACHPTDPYKYDFTINVTNPPGSTGCTYVLTSPHVLTNIIYAGTTITGQVAVTNPIPTGLNFTLQTSCVCPVTGRPMTCSQSFALATVCCKEIHVDDHVVCEEANAYDIPVYPSAWPPLIGTYLVTWYVTPKPASGICPTVPWNGQPYQSTIVNGALEPLHLFPNTLPGDVCVYAVVDLNDGPCTQLISNIAMVQLCKPNSCTLNGYDYCYTGSCITPGLITLTSTATPPTCFALVEWFDPAGNSVQIGGSTYQPPCLSMVDDQHCYEDFVYTAVITDDCGQHSCQSRIRLYSGNAPAGTLAVDPFEPNFFCPGEDATLRFTPGCADAPKKWTWFSRPCVGGTPVAIPGSGMMNPVYNTNQMAQSVIYSVQIQNGVCPADMVDLKIEVKEPLTIVAFTAVSDPCVEQFVNLTLDFLPCTITGCNTACNCDHTVEWYKDGFLIGTTTALSPLTQATFAYTSTPLAGNYYAVIRADCCPDEAQTSNVLSFDPACEPVVLGPCFICDNVPVILMAQMVIPPTAPCPTACTFTWYMYDLGLLTWVQIGSTPTITVSMAGHYRLDSDCNGCLKSVQFDLLGCTSGQNFAQVACGVISIQELMPPEESPLRIFPNPTTGDITVEWAGDAPKNARLFITDPMGRRLRMITVPEASTSLTTAIDDLPAGLYFVKVQSADRLFTVAKLVKE